MWLKIFQTSGLKNLNQRSVAPWIINVDSSKSIQKGTRSMLPWKNEMLVCWEGVVVNVFIKLHHTCSWWTLVFINYNLKSFWIEYFIHAHYIYLKGSMEVFNESLKRSTGMDGETSTPAIGGFWEIVIMPLNAYTSQIQDISNYSTTSNIMHYEFYRTQFFY